MKWKKVQYLYKKVNELKCIDKRDQQIILLLKNIKNNNYDKNELVPSLYFKDKINTLKKSNISICVLILSCDKYKERLKNITEKMLNNFEFPYLIVNCDNNRKLL